MIHEAYVSGLNQHYSLPNNQRRVYYLMSQRTPQWVTTSMEHGPPGRGEVPVRTCLVHGCINGKHHRWGTQREANLARQMPDQSGQNNPHAKLTALEVAQLRSVKWRSGYFKVQAAEAAGVSLRTLTAVLKGYTWKGIEPYVNAAEWASRKGDEF